MTRSFGLVDYKVREAEFFLLEMKLPRETVELSWCAILRLGICRLRSECRVCDAGVTDRPPGF
jgi:hypothetical protein